MEDEGKRNKENIIILLCEFFTSAFADGLSLESE